MEGEAALEILEKSTETKLDPDKNIMKFFPATIKFSDLCQTETELSLFKVRFTLHTSSSGD